MIRFAIIGTNTITEKFLEVAAKVPKLQLAGIYSRTKERAAAFGERYGVTKYYNKLEALASASDIDAVYIASPNCCHFEQAVELMKAGKHVLCEKPIASNYNEFTVMARTAREHGVVLMEAMRSLYDPGFEALIKQIPRLGTIRQVTFQFCQYSSRYDKYKQGIIENAFKPELSNGALMDIGVYCISPMVKLFGVPEKIYADSIFLHNGVDGAGTITARYKNGMQAQLIYSKISNSKLSSQIQGEEGTLLIDQIQDIRQLEFFGRKGEKEVVKIDKFHNNMLYEAEEFVRLIHTQGSYEAHLSVCQNELIVMDQARKLCSISFPADEITNTY